MKSRYLGGLARESGYPRCMGRTDAFGRGRIDVPVEPSDSDVMRGGQATDPWPQATARRVVNPEVESSSSSSREAGLPARKAAAGFSRGGRLSFSSRGSGSPPRTSPSFGSAAPLLGVLDGPAPHARVPRPLSWPRAPTAAWRLGWDRVEAAPPFEIALKRPSSVAIAQTECGRD